MVLASRKNLTTNPSAAAAAIPPAAININAATDRQARPAVVHPPHQQPPDPRDLTPNPKRRRRDKKAPELGSAQLPLQQQQQQQQQPKQQQQHQQQQRQKQQQQLQQQQQQLLATANSKSKGKGKSCNQKDIKKKQQHPPQQQEVPSAAASASGSGGATLPSTTPASKKTKELKQRPEAAAAQGNSVGDLQPPAVASGSAASISSTKGPSVHQQKKLEAPKSSSTVLDPETGLYIDEHLLRLCGATDSNTSKAQLKRLAGFLPPTFFKTFSNAQRVECARAVWDMAEASRIQTEKGEARRKAMIASDAKVKSDLRVAELERQLVKAKKAADAKAKEAAGSAQEAVAAATAKHLLCIQQDPRDILAPVTATASTAPTASAEKGSRPSGSTVAKSAKDAPKVPPKSKTRRPWNPKGRQQQQQQHHQQPLQ